MIHRFKQFILSLLLITLAGCGSQDKNTLKVGTISGPETQLMEVAKQVAKDKYGLNIEIIEFTDYIQPNAALDDGSIDANAFQHQPYLDQQIKNKHYKLKTLAKTFLYPMGVYSQKIKRLEDIPNNAIIVIPNDPSNEGRALLLLQKAGVIQLKSDSKLFATTEDIQNNPKHIQFKELDAGQLVRSLPDVTAAVINTNYAIPAGLSPKKDAIYLEGTDSPYANIIVIRAKDENDPRLTIFVQAFQSEAVRNAAKNIFNDQALPAWVK